MFKANSKRLTLWTLAGVALLALAVVAFRPLAALASTGNSPARQDATPPAQPAAGPASADGYASLFAQSFAQHLGVSEEALNAAYHEALVETAAKAVQDGKLTQAEADGIVAKLNNGGVGTLVTLADATRIKNRDPRLEQFDTDFRQNLFPNAVANGLGISADELKTELGAGKSIADIASAHNLDLAQVKQATLAALKAELDKAVQAGQLQQNEDDGIYGKIQMGFDDIASRPNPFGN